MHTTLICTNLRLECASTENEWSTVRKFRHTYFFGPAGIQDPYENVLTHQNHRHFVLYQATKIVGYAHVQFWPERHVIIRIMAIDHPLRGIGLGRCLIQLLEKWLLEHKFCMIFLNARPSLVRFYEKCGFKQAAFTDPEGYESDPQDIQMQK